jgi:hypothetical protein
LSFLLAFVTASSTIYRPHEAGVAQAWVLLTYTKLWITGHHAHLLTFFSQSYLSTSGFCIGIKYLKLEKAHHYQQNVLLKESDVTGMLFTLSLLQTSLALTLRSKAKPSQSIKT